MIYHAFEQPFLVLEVFFQRLTFGPCVGVVAYSELLLSRETTLVSRVPELSFAPDF
jgi:hypothetical protein